MAEMTFRAAVIGKAYRLAEGTTLRKTYRCSSLYYRISKILNGISRSCSIYSEELHLTVLAVNTNTIYVIKFFVIEAFA